MKDKCTLNFFSMSILRIHSRDEAGGGKDPSETILITYTV